MNLLNAIIAAIAARLVGIIAEPIINATVNPRIRKALPAVFDIIDSEMPMIPSKAAPEQVVGVLSTAIKTAAGVEATAADIDYIIKLYNPVAAAIKQTIK